MSSTHGFFKHNNNHMKSNYCLVDHVRMTSFVGSCSSHVMLMEWNSLWKYPKCVWFFICFKWKDLWSELLYKEVEHIPRPQKEWGMCRVFFIEVSFIIFIFKFYIFFFLKNNKQTDLLTLIGTGLVRVSPAYYWVWNPWPFLGASVPEWAIPMTHHLWSSYFIL
jgi:hypothetical protein